MLLYLIAAIENRRIKWGKTNVFANRRDAEFDYLGFRYRLTELDEVVDSIFKLGRVETPEEDDGEEFCNYELEKRRRLDANPDWGSFA